VAEVRRPVLPAGPRRHWEKALAHLGEPGGIYLPLLIESRVVGVLHASVEPALEVAPQERRVVESLANIAAGVLERDRLTRAQAHAVALQEADRLKTALLSMVSHDFRSPLAGIKAGVTTLLETEGNGGAAGERELLEGIDREADRLNRMVGNILALSRLESGAWKPQREPTPPEDLLGPALSPFPAEAAARVQVEVDPRLADCSVDPVQISQVLHNLIDNALKYSPAPAPVEVRLGREGGELVVEVADRGPGLPPGEEERVFEPFHRAADQRESARPGVGLGLAVCRGLVAAHGGTLTAANRPGGGARFVIRLPVE
jgi:two-component system sensor histidine kinase KdpD